MSEIKIGADQLIAGSSVLSRPAEEFVNDQTVEAMWATVAMQHAEIYFNLLCSVDPKLLRLTKHDDKIYKSFRESFPDLKVDVVTDDDLKSESAKIKWRNYCEQFKDIIEDYNFGTLTRKDCSGEYSEENTIFTSRIQFFAIELARNREGFNSQIRQKFKPKKAEKTSS